MFKLKIKNSYFHMANCYLILLLRRPVLSLFAIAILGIAAGLPVQTQLLLARHTVLLAVRLQGGTRIMKTTRIKLGLHYC